MMFTFSNSLLLPLLLFICVTKCDKFVAFMIQTRSHINPVLSIVKELEKINHSVTFVLSSSMQNELQFEDITVRYVVAKSLDRSSFVKHIAAASESMMKGSGLASVLNLLKAANDQCHDFMTDDELFIKLRAEKFDYAIVDFAPDLCFETLAYKLSLPIIFFSAHIFHIYDRTPFNPAFMPAFLSGYTDKMTFSQRIVNSFLYVVQLTTPAMPSFDNVVEKYVPEKPYLSNDQLKKSSLLHIVDGDVLLDYPHPVPPNVVLCGGLAARVAKPLNNKIENFVQMSEKGVVVMSFGSIIKTFPKEILEKLLQAFQKVKQLRFILRQGNEEIEMENVLHLPWLPQNDLLGHSKTKLFITHCGKSGLSEALYHAVPMIAFPMGLDQSSNAAILVHKGYGISMDILDFSVGELVANIEEVAFSRKYRENIQQASEIFHSRPDTPSQRAAYWIDLVTKYGPKHFRPASLDMPWYSFYLIDVILFYTFVFSLLAYTLKFLCRSCCRCCKSMSLKQKVD